ncbi:hypothetical protein [Mucilaginibacter conchicola]|nr:hypothetical protein [Mucilaginibacter conchicola]
MQISDETRRVLYISGVPYGRAIRSYACRPYPQGPVSTAITNATV